VICDSFSNRVADKCRTVLSGVVAYNVSLTPRVQPRVNSWTLSIIGHKSRDSAISVLNTVLSESSLRLTYPTLDSGLAYTCLSAPSVNKRSTMN